MARVDIWPDLAELDDCILTPDLDFEVRDGLGARDGFDAHDTFDDPSIFTGLLEFPDEDDDPVALVSEAVPPRATPTMQAPLEEAPEAPPEALPAASRLAAPAMKFRKKRRPKPRPPEKTLEDMAANAAAFHRWQRGERYAPPMWDVTEQFVRKIR